MSTNVRECRVERTELIQVHDHCPDRPYVELEVPEDARKVVAVTFSAISRDQGWADAKTGPSFTWFDAAVRRPEGRPDLGTLNVLNNRLADAEFHEQSRMWDLNAGIRHRSWVRGLQPKDVVQLIPKAAYTAWVNIVKHCRIRIEYEAKDTNATVIAPPCSNSHHYPAPLDAKSKEIRLIVVEPGDSDDPIKGYFKTLSLKTMDLESTDFHALSYCWGDPSDRVNVDIGSAQSTTASQVTKEPFSVGRTVEAALRRLRRKDKVLNIWIDAVCINQDDRKERAEQVNLMGDIFSRASTVHIWLGEDNPGVETCLRLVRDVFNYNNRICPGGDHCLCLGTAHSLNLEQTDEWIRQRSSVSFRGIFEVFELAQKTYSGEAIDLAGGYNNTQISVLMTALYRCSWFSRVWVVQEALLSSRAFVHCSGEIVPWEELVTVNDWLESHDFRAQQPHVTAQVVMAPIWKTLRQKKETPNENAQTAEHHTSDSPNILDVFLEGLDLKATDARDKLFALYPFGRETRVPAELDELVRPSYIKPARQVFADFTRWWIQTHRSLGILSAIHCQSNRTWQSTLGPDHRKAPFQQPTWALNSEGSSRWAQATLEAQFDFHATRTEPQVLDSPDPYVLRLSGRIISTIVAIGHVPIESIYPYNKEKNDRTHISAVFDRMFDPCAFKGFWGIRGRGGEGTVQAAAMDYMDHLRAHWGYFSRPQLRALRPTSEGQPDWYETNKLPTCLERCFFVGSNQRHGLCPWAAREGDMVVLLDGGNVPYLLRPVEAEGAEVTYELVGECFVDGIMSGEYFDGATDVAGPQAFSLV